jgi:SAM-dependent methyltransferase
MERRDPARERAHFAAVSAGHGELYWAERTAAGRRRRQIRSALLAAAAGVAGVGGRRVLEVGCGTCEYTRPFAARTGATVIAVDVTPELLVRAGGALPANVRRAAADVERLPFADGVFDAVVGNAVLHHLRLERAVPELARVLRPGGAFCFAEPNFLNPQVFLERTVPWLGRWLENSPDEIAFTRWRLRATLERLGLAAVRVRPFDFLYPLTPAPLIGAVERLGRALERTPLVAEIAGSLLVTARRPEGASLPGAA